MPEISMKASKIDCLVRDSIPLKEETILTDFPDFETIIKDISDILIYYRKPEDCPFARGNWIIDLIFKNEKIFCLKLPKEMLEEKIFAYIKPLQEKVKNARN